MDGKAVAKAILCSLLGLVLFVLMETLFAIVIGLVAYILNYIGLASISMWIARLITPDSFLIPIFSLFFVNWVISLFCKEAEQKKLCVTLLGAYLLALAIFGIINNLILGNSVWVNLTTGGCGLLLLFNKLEKFTK